MPKPTSDCRATERKHPWPMVRLGDVCIVQRGVRVTRKDLDDNGKYNVYQNSLKPLGKYNSFNCEAHSPFMIMALAAGEPGFSEEPFWAADDCTYFKNLRGLDNLYLYFLLSANKDELKRNVKQTTIPRLSNKFLESLEIPLPPLSVQREIVARLERELAAVEKIKKGFEALAETARAEFKAELKEVFEEISRGGAETRRLGEVCETITDGDHQPPPKSSQGVPFLVISNLASGRISFENTRFVPKVYYEAIQENRKPRKGDVLLTVTGSYGIPVVVETKEIFCFQRHIALIRTSRLDPKFLAYALLSPKSKRYFDMVATGAAQKTIGLAAIRAMNISFPSLSVQRQIVARLSTAKARAEKLEAKAREGVAVCETMRKAILKEAFDLRR